ncbi:MAG: hypothetical protein LIO43_05980 [Clostridiales bacterium]|nr:hypothetical protein [Clostridiales bacterium]
MKDNNNKQSENEILANKISKTFIKDPIFMYFCPEKAKRSDFIKKFFIYNFDKLEAENDFYVSENQNAVAALASPDKLDFRFSGKHSLSLKLNRYSKNILIHREIVKNIIDVVVPPQLKKYILTVYAAPDVSVKEINSIIDICTAKAKKRDLCLCMKLSQSGLLKFLRKKALKQLMSANFFQLSFIKHL